MTAQIQTAKFIANPGANTKIFAADIDVSDNPKYSSRGRLVFLFTLTPESAAPPSQIASHLAKGFYQSGHLPTTHPDLESLICLNILNDKVYVTNHKSFCFLQRSDKLAKIIDSNQKQIVGQLNQNDIFLLTTPNFIDTIDLKSLPITASFKDIDLFIQNSNPQVAIAAVIVKVDHLPASDVNNIIINEPLLKKTRFNLGFKKTVVKGLDFLITHLPDNTIHIQGDTVTLEKQKNRRVAASVGVILLVLLIVSVIFGLKNQKQKLLKQTYESRLSQAQHSFDEALNLKNLDQSRARELLLSADDLLKSILNEGIKDDKVTSLSQKIKDNLGPVAGIYNAPADLFVDLSLQTDDFIAHDVALSATNLLVLDSDHKKLIQVNLATKRTEIVAGPQTLPQTLAVANYVDKNYVLSQNGFWQVSAAEPSLVLEKNWDGDVLVHVFAGNLYLLEKDTNQIYRFSGTSSKFGSRQNWFGPGLTLDLSDTLDWSIDGAIWVLFPNGKVQKYERGTATTFKIKPVDKGLTSVTDIYTDEDAASVYLLDKGNNRVVVVTKDGDYQAEYSNDKIPDTLKIVVSEKDKKLILLTKDKLYSIELKHLN